MRSLIAAFAACLSLGTLIAAPASAAGEQIEIRIRDHKFEPAQIHVKAGEPVVLHVTNEDATPEEFESSSLGFEKIIVGGSDALVRLGALQPGQYVFFGEFHEDSAIGRIVAE